PESLGALRSLVRLDLRNNHLTSLPEAVGQLHSLRELDLRANRLVALPPGLAELPNLERLDLRWNKLSGRPSWLAGVGGRGSSVLLRSRPSRAPSPGASRPPPRGRGVLLF